MYKKVTHQERPFIVHICIGMTPASIARKLSTSKVKFQSDYFQMHDNNVCEVYDLEEFRPGHFCMVFRNTKISVGDIAHEATHCTAQHFRYIGQPLSIESEESYAYMTGWITQIIYNMIYEL